MRIPWVIQNGRPQQRLALTTVLLWIYIQTDRLVVCKSLHTEQADPVNACRSNPCANGGACVPETGLPWPPVVVSKGLPPLGYRCQCTHGWTGPNCTENVDDCISQPCLNGGVCEDLPNSRYWCHCQPGFVGINCEHADPCRSNPCENTGGCRANRLGEFTCDCPTWYAGQRCEQELDPCYPTSACRGPGATCQPVRAESTTTSSSAGGSNPTSAGHGLVVDFQCFCGPGYTGRYCDQAASDQCAHHNCLNNATCVSEGSHFTCICPTGFDGKRCENDFRLIAGAQFDLPPLSNGDDPVRINTEAPGHLCDILNCSIAQPGDGLCQAACLRHSCLTASERPDCYDWSGCLKVTGGQSNSENPGTCVERFGDGHCDKGCNRAACFSDGFDCHVVNQGEPQTCPSFCLAEDYADSVCQSTPCASAACGYDGGDCQTPVVQVEVNKSMFQVPENVEGRRLAMYWFFIAVLSTGANDPPAVRDQQIRQFLSTLGRLLRTSVRLAVDSLGENDIVVRTPRSGGDQIILAVARSYPGTPCGTNCSRTTDQRPWEKLNTTKQLAGFIRAALVTPNYRSPVPVKVFIPLTDVAQLEAFAEVMGQSSRGPLDAVGSRGAIVAYISLGLLAGILLILFPILKRDPWRRLVKRVRTSGIWYPPVPMTYKPGVLGEARPGFPAPGSSTSTVTRATPALLGHGDALPPTTGSQKQSLLASLDEQAAPVFGGLSGQHLKRKRHKAFDTKVESGLDLELAHRPEATWTLSRSGKHKAEGDQCSPIPTKRHFFDQGTCYCPATPSSTKPMAPLRRNGGIEESLERPVPDDPTYCLLDSKDGLHPLSSHEVGQFSRSLAVQQTPSSCEGEVPTADETLYHVVGRMNSGPEAVIAIASKMHSSVGQPNNKAALSWVDSNGRTPASAAAAANALETLGALHQVEREAVVRSSATLTGSQQQQGKMALATSRPSGRRRQRAMECRQTTPLMTALQAGNEEVLNQLLDEAYPLHGVDEIGRNVVHWAAATNAPLACFTRLAQCKGFYRLLNARDDWDRTPLLLAVREGCTEVVRFLLDHKALCQPLSTEAGQTSCFTIEDDPLRLAQDRGHIEIQVMLTEYYRQNGLDILSDSQALGQTASSKSSTFKVDDDEDDSNDGDEDGDDAGEREHPEEFEDDVEDEDGRAGDPSPSEERSTPGKVHGAAERAGPPLFYSMNSGRHSEAVDAVDNVEVNHNSGYPLVIPMPFKSAGVASPKFLELHRPSLNHLAIPTHPQFLNEPVFPQYHHHHHHPRSAAFPSHSLILPNGVPPSDDPSLGDSSIKYGAMRRTLHPPASFSTTAAVGLELPQGAGRVAETLNKLWNGRLHENGSQLI